MLRALSCSIQALALPFKPHGVTCLKFDMFTEAVATLSSIFMHAHEAIEVGRRLARGEAGGAAVLELVRDVALDSLRSSSSLCLDIAFDCVTVLASYGYSVEALKTGKGLDALRRGLNIVLNQVYNEDAAPLLRILQTCCPHVYDRITQLGGVVEVFSDLAAMLEPLYPGLITLRRVEAFTQLVRSIGDCSIKHLVKAWISYVGMLDKSRNCQSSVEALLKHVETASTITPRFIQQLHQITRSCSIEGSRAMGFYIAASMASQLFL